MWVYNWIYPDGVRIYPAIAQPLRTWGIGNAARRISLFVRTIEPHGETSMRLPKHLPTTLPAHRIWPHALRVLLMIGLALAILGPVSGLSAAYAAANPPIEPSLTWNTFLGSANTEIPMAIAVDQNRNVYVAGVSKDSWGIPVRAFSGASGVNDAFVAKLDPNGALLWNTFLGATLSDLASAIAVDGSGNVYVTGQSAAAWGSPLIPHAAGTHADTFVAKLNSAGGLEWNTFTGATSQTDGNAICLDGEGNIYIAGSSSVTWGSPLAAYSGGYDGFAAKLDPSGAWLWHTFLGSAQADRTYGLAVDDTGNTILSGRSAATWGSPLASYTGGEDAFVAKLDADGVLLWHTFMGSGGSDGANGVALDRNGAIVVSGTSAATWGNPLNAYSGGDDVFVAKMSGDGGQIWHTFLGSAYNDTLMFDAVAVDNRGRITVAGTSVATWGSPVIPISGSGDAFIGQLDTGGGLLWNAFLGTPLEDMGLGVAIDLEGDVYTTGVSISTWGAPVQAFTPNEADAFAAKISVPRSLFIPVVWR
jgi:hypothetical protein